MRKTTKDAVARTRELTQLDWIARDENDNLDGSFDPSSSVTLDGILDADPPAPRAPIPQRRTPTT